MDIFINNKKQKGLLSTFGSWLLDDNADTLHIQILIASYIEVIFWESNIDLQVNIGS